MNKIAYIIAGYGESPASRPGYRKIAKMFKEQGFKVVQVKIKWKYKAIIPFEKYTEQFLKQYKEADETCILGFSFGAIIALASGVELKPTSLILCSLSPYFKEDLKTIPPSWLKWYRKQYDTEYVFKDLASQIVSKTYLLMGSKEEPFPRVLDAKRKIKGSKLLVAKGAGHNPSHKEYLNQVSSVISDL
jgi:hypothetical protein